MKFSILNMKSFLSAYAVEALCKNQQDRVFRNLDDLAKNFDRLQSECVQLKKDLIAAKAELEAKKQTLKTEAELKEACAKEMQVLQQLNKRLTVKNHRAQRLIEYLIQDQKFEL